MKKLRPIMMVMAFASAMAMILMISSSTSEAANPKQPAHWVKGWNGAVNYYNTSKGKASLDRRTKGMMTLAATRDKRALTLLADRYKNAEEPSDYVRACVVFSALRFLNSDNDMKSLEVWAGQNNKARDGWLKYRVWKERGMKNRDISAPYAVAIDPKADPFHRGAAFEAISVIDGVDEQKIDLVMLLLKGENKPKETKRVFPTAIVQVGAATVLGGFRGDRETKRFKDALYAVVDQLDQEKMPRSVKLMIARHMRKLFDTKRLWINGAGWKRYYAGEKEKKKDDKPGGTSVQRKDPAPSFAGIPSNGDRFAYVIDISDSMLTPIKKPEGTKPPKKGPITGRNKGKKKKKIKDDPDALPSEKDLDWSKIKNRFELAREYLAISLKRTLALSQFKVNKKRDFYFTIIFFNENAKYFKSTNGLVKMTKGNVNAALKELYAIKSKESGKKDRPYGTLSENVQGFTNMHGGLRRAFGARPKAVNFKETYVDPKIYAEGVDTIFLLSDGKPSWSDFVAVDPWEQDVIVGDPETGTKGTKAENIQYHGPYHDDEFISDDVRRQNLVRAVELHCIGIGEAPRGLLSQLAGNNYGQTKFIGN